MAKEEAGLAQQALNKAAEIGLASQLDKAEKLEVDVQTDPLKLVQGELDSVEIKGEGLVMQQDLRMEELEMQMNHIAINPLSAAFGKIELTKPTEASVRAVLTESDINHAFNSEYISSMLQNLEVRVEGQPTKIDTKKVELRFPGEGKVALSADVVIRETNQTQQVAFTSLPRISPDGQYILLEEVQYSEGKELSPELTKALLEKVSEILNFRNFELEGMSFRINKLNVEVGQMTLLAEALVEKIPS